MITANSKTLIEIKDLHVSIGDKKILNGVNLTIKRGEIHAIMGLNGSGKSTLSKVLAGHPDYIVNSGTIIFDGQNLLDLLPEERARRGVFLAFQYPIEIPGVSNRALLRMSYNIMQKERGGEELDPLEFDDLLMEKIKLVNINESFLDRNVNEGFSGGEKKKNEILQMAILEPKLAILDETDSGLDIDALKVVANGVNNLICENRAIVMVTHYQRLLNYIVPDFVHVMLDGRIVKTGGADLALQLEDAGYDWLKDIA